MSRSCGVAFDWRGASAARVTDIARAADDRGYDYFLVPEAWGIEAFSTVTHILDSTSRIKVGTGIVNVYSRSAAVIGMASSTMAQLFPNRFFLGLGTSGRTLVEDFHGIPFVKPLERTREYAEVIRRVSSGDVVNYDGELLKLSNFRLFTDTPNTKIEIFIAALGDKNLRLAGRIADGAIVVYYPVRKIPGALRILGSGGPGKKLLAMFPLVVENSQRETQADTTKVKKVIAFYITSMGEYYADLLCRLGYGDVVSKVRKLHAEGDRQGELEAVGMDLVGELALVGPAESIRSILEALPKGVIPVLSVKAASSEDVRESVKLLNALA